MHEGWDWRKGEDGGTGRGGGDLNLKGALPQWESLPMNNHTDEPERARERQRKEHESWGLNRKGKKTNKLLKKKTEIRMSWNQASEILQARRLLGVFPPLFSSLCRCFAVVFICSFIHQ